MKLSEQKCCSCGGVFPPHEVICNYCYERIGKDAFLQSENATLKRVGMAAKAVCDYFGSFGLKREEQAIWDELENSVAELPDALPQEQEDE